MSKKRGFAAEQARWMFVVISGGLIMLFFYQLIAAEQGVSNDSIASDLALVVGSVAASSTLDSLQEINLPENVELRYDCNSKTLFVNGASKRFTGDAVLFVQDGFKGNNLFIRTKEFAKPFASAKVIFVADSREKLQTSDIEAQTAIATNENVVCGLKQISSRTKLVAAAHMEHINNNKKAFFDCSSNYGKAQPILLKYFEQESFEELKSLDSTALDNLNKGLVGSCPPLY